MPGSWAVIPGVVIDRGIYIPLAHQSEAANFGRLQKGKRTESVTDVRAGCFRVGGDGLDLRASHAVVESNLRDGEMLDRYCCRTAGTPAHHLDVARNDVVRVLRTEAEVPHDLGRHLGIVRIEQRKGQSRDVVCQLTLSLRTTWVEYFSVALL